MNTSRLNKPLTRFTMRPFMASIIFALSSVLPLHTQALAQHAEVPPVAHAVSDLNDVVKQIEQAANSLDYSGRYEVGNGEDKEQFSIISTQDGLGFKQKIWSLDKPEVELIRQQNEWFELLLKQEEAYAVSPIPGLFPAISIRPNDLNKYYRAFQLNEEKRLADRLCTPYSVISREADRPNWYLCVDTENQLLLERYLISQDNKILSYSRFNQVLFGQDVDVAQAKPSVELEPWLKKTPERVSVNPQKSGWRFRFPDGFEIVSSSQLETGTDLQTIQLVLSDGLSVFSIFIQKLNEQEKLFSFDQQMFMHNTVMYAHRVDDYVVIATGMMPMQTLKAVATSATFIPPVVAP